MKSLRSGIILLCLLALAVGTIQAQRGQDWMDEVTSEGPDPHSCTNTRRSADDQDKPWAELSQVCLGRFVFHAPLSTQGVTY